MASTSAQHLYPYIDLFYQALGLSERQDAGLNNFSRSLHPSLGRHGLYYELKQGLRGLEIDLSCEIPVTVELDKFTSALQGLDMPQPWYEMIQGLLFPKTVSCSSKLEISLMGLEFDTHCPYPLRPSIFFTSPKVENSNIQWMQAIMNLARETGFSLTGIEERINTFLNVLHTPSRIVHAGFMLPRGNKGAMKCVLSGITEKQLLLLADTLDLSLSRHLYYVWSKMVNEGSKMHLALDFVADRPVKPAWEIFYSPNKYSLDDKWSSLIQYSPDYVYEGLKNIKTKTCVQSWMIAHPWPEELKCELLCNAHVVNSLMITKLNHIKLFDNPERQMQYKCYYYQCPAFQTNSGKLAMYRDL